MKYIKTIIVFLIIVLINIPVMAEEEILREEIIFNHLDKINLSDLQSEINKINQQVEGQLPTLDIREIVIAFIKGEFNVNWSEIIKMILRYLGQEVTVNLNILGQIIILTVISAVLKVFHNSFSSKTISETANVIIYLILAVILLQSFRLAVNIGLETVDNMLSFMQALIPVLLTLLVSVGALSSAVLFHPLTFLIITLLSGLIKNIIFPMIFISAILSIVNNINKEISISRLASLFKKYSVVFLTMTMGLFITGLMLQGGAAAITDSLSLRAAKSLTGTFIPVMGGVFSSAIELIITSSLLLKNALNIFGLLTIIVIIAYPIIKLIALIFIYKLASALVQPIADQRLLNILDELGNCIIMVFVVVTTVSIMFFLVLTIMVGTANLTVMMR